MTRTSQKNSKVPRRLRIRWEATAGNEGSALIFDRRAAEMIARKMANRLNQPAVVVKHYPGGTTFSQRVVRRYQPTEPLTTLGAIHDYPIHLAGPPRHC